jgi:hypothetical protein
MGLYDHIRINDSIVKVLNQYTGCNQQLDGDFQTSVHDQLARLYINADLTTNDIPDGAYPIRYFYGHTLYFVVNGGSVSHWLYQYSFKQGGYTAHCEFNKPKVIASKKVEHGIDWRTVTPDSREHIVLMTAIQHFLYGEPETKPVPIVPPMVEILSIIDLGTFGNIQAIMGERAICDYLIYKLETDHSTGIGNILANTVHTFHHHRHLFDRFDWHPTNDTRASLIEKIQNEKTAGESYVYKITPYGKWEQLQSAIKRLHQSYEFN